MLKKYLKWLFFIMFTINSLNCIAVEQKFTDHDGKTINMVDYKNKWKLFVYVSSGCQYCKKEIVILNELIGAHQDKLMVFGYNTEGLNKDESHDFVAKANIKFSMLQQNPAAFIGIKHIRIVPTMVFVKPDGNILEPMAGLRARKQLEEILLKDNK
jgi:peroxiredoxin